MYVADVTALGSSRSPLDPVEHQLRYVDEVPLRHDGRGREDDGTGLAVRHLGHGNQRLAVRVGKEGPDLADAGHLVYDNVGTLRDGIDPVLRRQVMFGRRD